MAKGAVKPGEKQAFSLDYQSMLCLLGMFAGVSALLNVVFVEGGARIPVFQGVALKVFLLAVMALAFFFYYFTASRMASVPGKYFQLACSFGGLCAWVVFALGPFENVYTLAVLSFLAGFGLASLMEVWFAAVCHGGAKRATQSFVAVAFAASAALCLAGSFFAHPLVQVVVTGVLWALSMVLFAVGDRMNPVPELAAQTVPVKDSDSRSKIRRESAIMLVVIYAQFGFLAGQLVSARGFAAPWVITAALFMAVILAIDGFSSKPRISEASIYSITIPLTVAVFAALYLFGTTVHTVALCVLAVVVTIYLTIGWVALARHVVYSRLSPLRVYAKARAGEYLGVAGGFALGCAVQVAFAADSLAGIRIAACVAVAYVFVASFFHKDRFPDITIADDGERKLSSVPAAKGLWKRRCSAVSERYGLSERQREVLVLIGQGRNAEYVANTLVISVSTVQTHIRNIYQKLGVHSRQELLDLIESTKLYGED